MNKYSSKAVKTAATVGMSLAMVLSAAAPVMAAGEPAGVCAEATKDSKECGRDLYVRIKDAMGENVFADIMMDGGTTITIDSNAKDNDNDLKDQDIIRTIVAYNTALSEYRKATASSTEYTEIGKWLTAVEKINEMFNDFTSVDANANNLDAEIAKLKGTAKDIADNTAGDWSNADGDLVEGKLSEAKAALKDMNTFEGKYFNNMSEAMQDRFAEVKSSLEILLTGHLETSDETIAKFVEAFDKVLQNDIDGKDTTLNAAEYAITGLGTKDGDNYKVTKVNLASKTALKQRINKIKNATDYDDVKDADAVVALIDAYQELIDNLGDLSTILTSDAYTAYTKTKTDDAKKTVRSVLMTASPKKYDAITSASDAKDEMDKFINSIDSEQWAILQDLKSDVLDLAFDFATKKIGNYYSDKGSFVDGVSSTQIATIKANVPGALLKVVDTETGEFGYDYLEAHMTKVADALNAVTKDIEKLTPANIKASDKATLEAAEDAYYDLTDNGEYAGNLNKAEVKVVRSAGTKITNLREAFDNLGTTAVAGWYDMGNGNWGYNNEDGTPAAYKWVASGSDWYMIKDGKMLRNTWLATDGGRWYYLDNAGKMVTNQSVDGCWINSYGVYMSPSYNG